MLEALSLSYRGLVDLARSLDEQDSWRPTGCAGWVVRDLLHHLLADAQRALVALGTPAEGPADATASSYWRLPDPGGADQGSVELRATRTMASQWGLRSLVGAYEETSSAVLVQAGRADADGLVRTQGRTLTVSDLLSTLVVEATVHHLDLVVGLDRSGPPAEGLAETEAVLAQLLGRRGPGGEGWIRAATGRAPLDDAQRSFLGPSVSLLPLLH